jgi:membrane protease YdiL (CAAX protease family)
MKKVITLWILAALIVLASIVLLMETSLPIFTIIWLVVPLIIIIRNKKTVIGIGKISKNELIKYTLLHFILLTIIYLIFEPWSGSYKLLIEIAVNTSKPDPTFVWLTRYNSLQSYSIMFLVTIFVTIFGEELFFRGYLYHYFKDKLSPLWGVIIQAGLFAVPNLVVGFMMPALQSIIFIFMYAFLAIGCVGGYTAYKSETIWPGLISASIMNLILVLIYF